MEEEIDRFYCTLDNTMVQYRLEKITTMGDLNGKVKKEWDNEIVGKFRPRAQ